MAKKLKVGDVLRGYTVTKVFGPGAMAISYAAQASDGRKVFLKQYKSPAPTVVWYAPFVDYQQELAARVRGGKGAHYAVRLVDAFEERWGGPCYFQAYEFVEHGGDLGQILDEERAQHTRTGVSPMQDPAVWARHVTWAKVFIAAVAGLHESKVVHADLKPPNVYLIKDASIAAGYQLKLIDMDFSVLADRRAPWHGHQGYVGTDNYRSPEHMTRGAVPGLASDVFTCGLILHELLTGVHPYWRDDQSEYARLVQAHAAPAPKLAGLMLAPASNAETSAALHACLDPNPASRPTAAELRAVLSGRGVRSWMPGTSPGPAASAAPGTTVGPKTAVPARGAGTGSVPLTTDRVRIAAANGTTLDVGVRTEIGKHLARQFGPDAEFWDARQCVLERRADRQWQVVPAPATANETLLNGEIVTAAQLLHDGDVLAVGRKAKGIIKLPLSIRSV
ncbi:MAG: protein kinase [Gemmatimonadota bacterium]